MTDMQFFGLWLMLCLIWVLIWRCAMLLEHIRDILRKPPAAPEETKTP